MSDDIASFDAIDHVRLRPGMYIGGTDKRALHNLIEYILEEITTDILLNRCSRVAITLQAENWICIRDNGLGLPLTRVDKLNKLMLEVVVSHSGIRRGRDGSYKYVSEGMMDSLLIYAINALSSEFQVEVASDDYLWQQTYREGRPQTALTQVRKLEQHEATGTTFTFKPDLKIFDQVRVDYKVLRQRLFELAMLLKTATFAIRDERSEPHKEQIYHFENGLIDYVKHLRGETPALHPIIYGQRQFPVKSYRGDTMTVEFAFQYVEVSDTEILSFVNTIPTVSGTHVTGFYNGLSKLLSDIAFAENWRSRRNGLLPPKKVGTGLRAVIHVLHPEPHLESQTNHRLLNEDVASVIEQSVYTAFADFYAQNPDVVQGIAERCANPKRAE